MSKRKAGEAAAAAEGRSEKKAKMVPVRSQPWTATTEGRPEGLELEAAAIEGKEATRIFTELNKLPFVRLPHRGQRLKRAKVMYVDISADGETGALYRFPAGNESAQKVDYTPLADAPEVVRALRDKYAAGANNVIVTRFADGTVGIPAHSDNRIVKYADMQPGKPIVDLVFFERPDETRPFTYRRDGGNEDEPCWVLTAGHGAKITLSDAANRGGQHAVPEVGKRGSRGARISVVFRYIQGRFAVDTRKPVDGVATDVAIAP